MGKISTAIIGSGNIGTDLMIKIRRYSPLLECTALAGIDPASEGLSRARTMGIATSAEGLDGLLRLKLFADVRIVFDASSADAHAAHAARLKELGKQVIDLTPAALGPFVVPVVNMEANLQADNVNMVSCGGQATIPMVAAISSCGRVPYAEIVASIASKSAGPGTRANIDQFTATTSQGIERVGRAERAKAIIVLNPAEPPLIMRNTVFAVCETTDEHAIDASVRRMVDRVRAYVPGYRLKQPVQFERLTADAPLRIAGAGQFTGLKVSVFLEIAGAAHFLPRYAGNLDIMTSAAIATAERLAQLKFGARADASAAAS